MSLPGLAERCRGLRIHQRVAALAVACILPTWVFVGYLSFAAYDRGRQDLEQALSAATQTQLRGLEREMAAVEASLRALATSPNLVSHDYAGFYAQAQEVLRQSPGLNIVLLGPKGEQVINTLQPYGQKLPTNPPDLFATVVESRQPFLSNLFVGPVTGRPLISMVVPVLREGRVENVLGMSLDAKHLSPVLREEGYPDSWVAAIFDRDGTIVARTRDPEKYVGRPGAPAMLEATRASRHGLVDIVTLEGIPVLAAFSRSELFGWTFGIAVPRDVLEANLKRSLMLSLSGGTGLLLLSLLLAYWIAGGIIRPVRSLIPSAAAIGRGEPVPAEALSLREAEEVRQALADAATLIENRTVERDQALIRTFEFQQKHRMLRALNDIAALPGGDANRQLAETLRLGAQHFGLPLGIVSHIEDGVFTVLHRCSPTESVLASGRQFDLGQTYCALTLAEDGVMAIPHMAKSVHAEHPCHAAFGLEAYIGAPISVRGHRFGTLSFGSAMPLGREFNGGDKEFMRLLARWVGTVLERQMSDAEIASTRRDLERSNEELSKFAYVASHDLRQPLRMVTSYLGLIERRLGPALDGEIKEFMDFAVDGARRMDQLIRDLLEYAAIGRDATPPERVDLGEVVAESQRVLALASAEAEARIEVAPALPTVLGNRGELGRLFQNLVGNAIKYRAEGRAPLIEIGCRDDGAAWEVWVRDNGIGIAREDFQRAFGVFQRLVDRDAYEGTGIGLSVCQKIVERHGGRIWIESELGQGTRFRFTLPKAPAERGVFNPLVAAI